MRDHLLRAQKRKRRAVIIPWIILLVKSSASPSMVTSALIELLIEHYLDKITQRRGFASAIPAVLTLPGSPGNTGFLIAIQPGQPRIF